MRCRRKYFLAPVGWPKFSGLSSLNASSVNVSPTCYLILHVLRFTGASVPSADPTALVDEIVPPQMSVSVLSDHSRQTRRRSGINITVFSDAGELVKIDDVLVDETLQKCLISRALVNDLTAEYQPLKIGSALDDGEEIRPTVGNVELQWHRRGSGKPYIEIFDVVDTTSSLVVLRRIPEEDASEVFSLGLEMQTEGTVSTSHP